MGKIFVDVETCGFHGMAVLIQWAEDDGPIQLFEPWNEPVIDTLKLIEKFCEADAVIGFNLAFDWFHICKLYTTFVQFLDSTIYPIDCIDQVAEYEMMGRNGPCIKPKAASDIMLYARKGPYQSTMNRGDIIIRRVPTALAWQLAQELDKRITLSDVYFAKAKDKSKAGKWHIDDCVKEGEIDPDFKNLVLKFKPSSALKALAADALKLPPDDVLLFADVNVHKRFKPEELGYAPFARAIGTPDNWRGAWPSVIQHHINHWRHDALARRYAMLDVDYTRALYKHFGSPEPGDDDSELACMVGAVRWRGFNVDLEGIKSLKEKALNSRKKTLPTGQEIKIPTAPKQVRFYIQETMDETEKLGFGGSTNKEVLKNIVKTWKRDCTCGGEDTDCKICKGTGEVEHPCVERVKEVLNARQSAYEADLYDKFLRAGRFHASFAVIGTLSSRMGGGSSSKGIEGGGRAGGDKLNPQGIKKTKEVRGKFPLADPKYILCGGDFSAFEVTLAEAEYNDNDLRRQLLTCENCNSEMVWITESISVREFLGDNLPNYIKWRLKKEEKEEKEAKDKIYIKKTEEEIKNEYFENDMICKACGSNKGKKIHALFGVNVFPEYTYEGLKATEGTSDDKYTRSKSAVFSMLFGGTEHTLMTRLGVPLETALAALAKFHKQFPGVKRSQELVKNMFEALKQPGGIGSRVQWHNPADYVESMFGFRRYFTLENQICKALYTLANAPPKSWQKIQIKVLRRERVQTASGAVQSALYGAAFGIQSSTIRAANNHKIQSSGATITKSVQRNIWDLQPSGVHEFVVIPMNIHDEIMCPTLPDYVDKVAEVVRNTVESFRPKVPLIKMDWAKKLNSWADKS